MHINLIACLLLVFSLLSTTKLVSSVGSLDRAISVGYGYSVDSEQVTHQACFNANVGEISDRTARIELSNTVSTSDLQKTFGVDLSVKGGYGLFAADAKAEYLRSIEEDESSISLNYYVVNQEDVEVQISGIHDEALNSFGQQIYHDDELNKYFGLQCGDYYIASYKQGAVLFVGLNIKLNSKEDKVKLEGSIGANYGSFVSVSAKIQSVSNEKKISGTVQVRGYQFGGDPGELTGIMSENIANCNIQDMSECKKVVGDLISYAKVFGNQIKDGKGMKALGSFVFLPIARLGLKAPNTTVTPEVKQCRKDLAFRLKENRYYARKLSPFVGNKYPVKLSEKLITHIRSLLSKVNHNIELIMDLKKGAARCFNTPEKCEEIKTEIYDNLKNIKADDLKFLKYMKYFFHVPFSKTHGYVYNTGEDYVKWGMCPSLPFQPCNSQESIEILNFKLTEENRLEYHAINADEIDHVGVLFQGSWSPSVQGYRGLLQRYDRMNGWVVLNDQHVHKIYESPFFFELYNSTTDAA